MFEFALPKIQTAAITVFATFFVLTGPSLSADLPFPVKGQLSGIVGVKDGDGVMIGGVEVRLQGIAAPEDNGHRVDPGGKEATDALRRLIGDKFVICYLDGSTTRGRPVGVCHLAGEDVGRVMVRQGFARDCPRFSDGRYAADEKAARADGKNLKAIYPLPRYC